MPTPIRRHVYIRCDAGPDIGLGHLMRQAQVARALRAAQVIVTFVSKGFTGLVSCRDIDDCYITSPHDIDTFLLDASLQPKTLVIMDVRDINQDLCRAIQEHAPVVQFDPPGSVAAANLVVFPNLHTFEPGLMFFHASHIRAGREYVIIPKPWGTRRRYPHNEREPHIVITAGGGDSLTLLNRVADVARKAPWGRHAILMTGGLNAQAWSKINRQTPAVWRMWEPSWIFSARVAVIPLGQTLYEALYAWTPCIAWARTPSDHARLANLHPYLVRTAGSTHPWEEHPDAFADAITQAWEDTAWQHDAITNAQALDLPIDGAARIARACLALLTD